MQDFAAFAECERHGWADAGIVGSYVDHFDAITGEAADALLAVVPAGGRDVLDLCCGQGTLTARLAGSGARATGLDFSAAMLERAALAAPGAALRQGDAAALPFDAAAFDAVLCTFGMMHLPDQPRALAEIRRVLRPGGTFGMATWVGPEASPAFGAVMGAIREHADLSNAPAQPDLFAFARPATAKAMLEAAGLRMTQHRTIVPAWRLSEPGELFEIYESGTVGISMIMRSQAPAAVEAIRRTITQTVRTAHAEGDGWRVPVPVALVLAEAA